MGEFRFRIPKFWELETRHARTVHVVGIEGIPRPSSVSQVDDLLIVKRNQNESGKTYIAYPFSKRGELTICTGTLPESDNVYDLVTELARGTINRLRNQTSIWEEGGLGIPSTVRELTRKAIARMSQAATGAQDGRQEAARDALEFAIDAIFELSNRFGTDIAEFRVSESEIPSFWMATTSPEDVGVIESTFDILAVQPGQLQDSAVASQGRRSIVGPLLDASPHSAFSTDHEDFSSGRAKLLADCHQLLKSMPSNAALIHAASGLNGIGHKNLSYRQQIQLTTDLIGLIDDSACETPVMVSFDYPWAERMAWSVGGIHPLQIADDIMRNGSRISFIGLDINLDYWPNGSVARDPLQWIDLIDLWSQLGLPLVICLRVPQPILVETDTSGVEFRRNHDENVTIAIESEQTTEAEDTVTFVGNSIRENLTDEQRLELLSVILPMIIARPGVHGIFWRQWSDGEDQRYPSAGLVNDANIGKTTMEVIRDLRKNTLQR